MIYVDKIDVFRHIIPTYWNHQHFKLPDRVNWKKLNELLYEQPYCKVKFLGDRGIAKRQTAAEYLRELEKAGILRSKQVGRENLFVNVKLYDLLVNNE